MPSPRPLNVDDVVRIIRYKESDPLMDEFLLQNPDHPGRTYKSHVSAAQWNLKVSKTKELLPQYLGSCSAENLKTFLLFVTGSCYLQANGRDISISFFDVEADSGSGKRQYVWESKRVPTGHVCDSSLEICIGFVSDSIQKDALNRTITYMGYTSEDEGNKFEVIDSPVNGQVMVVEKQAMFAVFNSVFSMDNIYFKG